MLIITVSYVAALSLNSSTLSWNEYHTLVVVIIALQCSVQILNISVIIVIGENGWYEQCPDCLIVDI